MLVILLYILLLNLHALHQIFTTTMSLQCCWFVILIAAGKGEPPNGLFLPVFFFFCLFILTQDRLDFFPVCFSICFFFLLLFRCFCPSALLFPLLLFFLFYPFFFDSLHTRTMFRSPALWLFKREKSVRKIRRRRR